MPKGYLKDGTPIRPPRAGKGKPKGAIGSTARDLKAMILAALNQVGGQSWLAKQANQYPAAFFGLVGRLVPMQTDLNVDGSLGTYDISDKPITAEEWAASAQNSLETPAGTSKATN